ncbi:neutral zinc metallopeptidase [Frankia sp. AgB32]|uniref:KPN_02809 family neutral zinc metallopeptidase n=1 Tax=Frankia sp. AgB32 TaxID=631119 RepID=UPI00200E1669|nr:neutral zinc metallopeptidase [Frankia sp. AgB32]MCK9895511.1 neutral zinc metallopeptidase [Frankia sp. AgB32]
MRFDDQSVDASELDDQRGSGGGGGGLGRGVAVGGGGAGILGLVIYLLVTVLGGGSDSAGPALSQPGSGASSDVAQRCNTAGAIDKYDDCFVLKAFNEVNEVWTAQFGRSGKTYTKPRLVYFSQAVRTGCGAASAQVGPFYCPPDRKVYIDLGFLDQLQRDYGAQGRYAQAYIVAHEVGHHLQTLTGTETRLRQAQQADPSRENELSVQLELQADCYAGVWSTLANTGGNVTIGEAELDEALGAAQAVGDDRIQARAGEVNPETWTHGSAQQRRDSFLTGYRGASMSACGTVPHA